MNILFISHENSLGGGTRSLLALIDEIRKNSNYNVYVFIHNFNETLNQGRLDEELEKRKVKYFKARAYWWMTDSRNDIKIKSLVKQLFNFMAALRLKKISKTLKIDIIHSNSLVTNVGAITARMSKIKHIWHIREFGDDDHNLKFIFDKRKCFEFINNSTDEIICISKAVYEKFEDNLDRSKMNLIYNGIKIPEVQPIKGRKNSKTINLLIVGRISENKGQIQAILAVKELINRGYTSIQLNIAGTGEKEYIDELKSIVETYGLASNVKFLGQIIDLDSVRECTDIELVCSKKEAFGRVTIEAMLKKNPVIGANTGGTKELIKEGFNGMLYEENNILDLANKIESVSNDLEKVRLMGENAYNYAKEKFTAEINANNIMKLYNSIINN